MTTQTFAQRQRLQKLTEEQARLAAMTESLKPADMTAKNQVFLQLQEHQAILKPIRSRQLRDIKKREFLPDYIAYIDGLLAANTGEDDLILPTILIWMVDAQFYSSFQAAAEYALINNMKTPNSFSSTLMEVLLRGLSDQINTLQFETVEEETFDLITSFTTVHGLSKHADIADDVRLAALKAAGFVALAQDSPTEAVNFWEQAYRMDPQKSGVKKRLDAVKKDISANGLAD